MESAGRPTDGDVLRALLARTSDYAYVTDPDGRIRLASHALARVLGFDDPAQLTGRLGVELPVGADGTRVELRDERGEPAGTLAIGGAAGESCGPTIPTCRQTSSTCARTRWS